MKRNNLEDFSEQHPQFGNNENINNPDVINTPIKNFGIISQLSLVIFGNPIELNLTRE
jgi:hypothetical protein